VISSINILSARRAYEFRNDGLRLTVLTIKPVQQAIQQAFDFQLAQVGTPIALFGDILGTIPPGLVFNYGLFAAEGESANSIPIRLLHVEPQRIIIDVVGPSSAIGDIYERFKQTVQAVADALKIDVGTPIIGDVLRTREYSELTAQCSWPLKAIFAPSIQSLLSQAAGMGTSEHDTVFEPSIYAQPQQVGRGSSGAISSSNSLTLQLAPRLGTNPEDNVHFSGALLDSDSHIAYIKALDEALSAS
jgi:hypothetical protein